MKRDSTLIMLLLTLFLLTFSCSSDDLSGGGACSVACGGFQFNQPFTFTEYKFISEEGCRKKLEEARAGCRAAWCPPTGDEDDCIDITL